MLDELEALAPLGYSLGLHIRYASPLVYHSTYTAAWARQYNENSYYLRDPTVFWGIASTGVIRWSEITFPDPFDVLGKASNHGLRFGATASHGPMTSRSICGIARDDREFNDEELALFGDIIQRLHDDHVPPTELTTAQVEALQCIANGDRHTAASAKLGISESALKARLKSARIRLEARTTSEAVRKAREYRLL
ncbi:autoinducer binding domain-containing protein [Thioclava sp. SK-1]|uniref:autoinducer binding domain-containing protein n=1 Tax=Thioclava sp. SK-1 TaxID=1889770 RepID=UPI0021013A54|nr:autoinducer binding domain-containing protein [Thioclava sp. SK-1]